MPSFASALPAGGPLWPELLGMRLRAEVTRSQSPDEIWEMRW